LKLHTQVSQRDINEPEFVDVRASWLKIERDERRKLEIIVKRPVSYNDNPAHWDEIWPDDVEEIWDAERELNEDEIPFTCDTKAKQIVSFGEVARNIKDKISYVGKYRQGTLALVMNFKTILFFILIFKKGGVGVTEALNKLVGTAYAPVYLFCSESGNMTLPLWIKTMILIQNATKQLRGCRQSHGRDWTKAVVLNIDNYGVHLNSNLAESYAQLHGIFLRCLIRNCSHIQQPIDQHVGKYFKSILKKLLSKFSYLYETICQFSDEIDINLSKWRQIVVRLVVKGSQIFQRTQNMYILPLSWVNFGLYLPLDGSKDKDLDTLHKNTICHSDLNKQARQREVKLLMNKVIISKRTGSNVIISRDWTPVRVPYSIAEASKNSHIQQSKDIIVNNLREDSLENHRTDFNRMNEIFRKDLSDLNIELPTFNGIIRPVDVHCLIKLYKKYASLTMIHDLRFNKLCLPTRDSTGLIIRLPSLGIFLFYISIIKNIFMIHLYHCNLQQVATKI